MLAQPAYEPFDSDAHLFEIKWDGTRCMAYVHADRLRLQNRRSIEMRDRYPELHCLSRLPAGTLLDGEIIILDNGKPSLSKLAQREHIQNPTRVRMLMDRLPATLIAFDLLYDAGENLMPSPLVERRERLKALIDRLGDSHVIVPDYIVGRGKEYFAAAEKHALEGIMAKRLDSPYQAGKRSPYWLKIKVARTDAFDVLGFVPREGEPVVSALIVGEQDRGRWVYKANVGSGFTEGDRKEWYAALVGLPPLAKPPKDGPPDGQWRATGLEVPRAYFEKTVTGKLRAPVFEGFIDDSSAT